MSCPSDEDEKQVHPWPDIKEPEAVENLRRVGDRTFPRLPWQIAGFRPSQETMEFCTAEFFFVCLSIVWCG